MKPNYINTDALNELMRSEHLKNHAHLARVMGVNRSYISQLINKRRKGSLYLLSALEKAFPKQKELIHRVIFFE